MTNDNITNMEIKNFSSEQVKENLLHKHHRVTRKISNFLKLIKLCLYIFSIFEFCFGVPCESENVYAFAGYEIKCMWPIFKPKMLTYLSKANLDERILFGKIIHF